MFLELVTLKFFNASLEGWFKYGCTRDSMTPSYNNYPNNKPHGKSLHIFHSIFLWPNSTLYSLHRVLLQSIPQVSETFILILCLTTVFYIWLFCSPSSLKPVLFVGQAWDNWIHCYFIIAIIVVLIFPLFSYRFGFLTDHLKVMKLVYHTICNLWCLRSYTLVCLCIK